MTFYSRIFEESTLDRQIGVKKSTGELTILVALGVLGTYVAIWSQLNLPATDPLQPGTSGMGARQFPQFSGVVMALTSFYLIGQHYWRQRKGTLDESFVGMKIRDLLRIVTFLGMVTAYFLVFNSLGFLLSTTIMLYATFRLLEYPERVRGFVAAVGFTLFTYIVFVVFLRLPISDPILGPISRVIL
jgi:hypothetical protein